MMATAVLAWSMLLPMPVQGQGDTSSAPCGSDSYLDPESQSCTPLSRCNTQCSGTTGTSFYGACSCPTFCLACNFHFGTPSAAECVLCGSSRYLLQGLCVAAPVTSCK